MSVWEKIRNWFIMDPPDGEEPPEEGVSDEIIEDGYDPDYDEEPGRRGWFGFGRREVEPKNMVMYINYPCSFRDTQKITDHIINGHPVVVNFEKFSSDEAQRTMDFISGCIYTLKGSYQQVSKQVFVFAPKGVRFEIDEAVEEETFSHAG